MASIPPSVFWGTVPPVTPAAPTQTPSTSCALPNLYPGGFQPAAGSWQVYVNQTACQFCLYDTNSPMPFAGDSNWQAYGIQYAQGPAGSVQDINSLYRQMFGTTGWTEFCPSPGATPPTPIAPLPIPVSGPQPGSSCDNPLFFAICPPSSPTSQPPTTPPEPTPSAPPSSGGPPPAAENTTTACGFTNLADFMGQVTVLVSGCQLNMLTNPLEPLKAAPFIGDPMNKIFQGIGNAISCITLPPGCTSPEAGNAAAVRILVSVLEHYSGAFPEWNRTLNYVVNGACPTVMPSASDANKCLLYNTIGMDEWRYWVRINGHCERQHYNVMLADREKPTAEQLIEFGRRVGVPDQQIQLGLKAYGWINDAEAYQQVYLYDELPTVQDILHFLQRNVFDTQYVQDYNLMEGFDERFWTTFGPTLRAQGITQETAAFHYAAHWINPAPGQLQTMVYRLRPDKEGVENPFTVEDYTRILAEQDVAPYFRERFAETVYQVPALGYVRDMYRSYIISDDELKSIHQDLGYSEENSIRFVQIDQLVRARMRAAETHGWIPSALAKAFISGQMTLQRVTQLMGTLGYTAAESQTLTERAQAELQYSIIQRARSRVTFQALSVIKSGIDAGVMEEADAVQSLVGLGWPQQFAQGWVGIQSTGARVKLVKQATSRIRSEFLSGAIDIQQASSALSVLGITQSAAELFLSTWQIQFTPKIKRRSAGQIVNDVANDEMSTAEALVRLTNLGYPNADSQLFLADAQRKILARELQQERLTARSDRQAATELARLLAAAEKQQQSLIATLKRISSPQKLQKWAKLGIIGRDLFFERMRTFGYDDSDTERWYEEACAAKGSACSETTPATPNPPAGASGTGFPG